MDGFVQIYEEFAPRGLEILNFPTNQFMGQEPKSNNEIAEWMKTKFEWLSPIMELSDVNGPNTNEVFRWLRLHSTLYNKDKGDNVVKNVPWNFCKFMVYLEGTMVKMYSPLDPPSKMKELLNELMPTEDKQGSLNKPMPDEPKKPSP